MLAVFGNGKSGCCPVQSRAALVTSLAVCMNSRSQMYSIEREGEGGTGMQFRGSAHATFTLAHLVSAGAIALFNART